MGALREKQSKFLLNTAFLFLEAERLGYELTYGDAWAKTGHMNGSNHYARLAVDLNLFIDGEYVTDARGHTELHDFWENKCGGAPMIEGDPNHYSYEHRGVV